MPILISFKPEAKITDNVESIAQEFSTFIISSPFLSHQGARARKSNNSDGSLASVDVEINGLSVTDAESHNLFETFVKDRASSFRFSFVLSDLSYSPMQPNDRVFLSSRFKPYQSKYSKLLSKISDLTIPDEFCCPLSGDIMEVPVYDIRSPAVRYDETFLEYWIGISHPKLVPHTKAPYRKNFFKIDFELQKRITDFVRQALEKHDMQQLEIVLQKFNLPVTREKDVINKALRRAAMSGAHEDLMLLFAFGADVNGQDDNSEKKWTALHWALSEKKYTNAATLIHSGALINVQNAQGVTALQLITALSDQREKESLIFICEQHKLIESRVTNNVSTLFFHNQQRQLDVRSGQIIQAHQDQHGL